MRRQSYPKWRMLLLSTLRRTRLFAARLASLKPNPNILLKSNAPLPTLLRISQLSSMATSDKVSNKLIHEKSPYLLQHAYNPVQWFPWGKEAFDKAKDDNKMIFLSIGYSTCHWCHVMERESFENAEIGKVMNDNYVCIKVDREERPDVDRVYMTFVQATTGGGGWPLSIWLTPDLKPVVGGTYFPPSDRQFGRPGFKTILLKIATQWNEQRDKVKEQGESVLNALTDYADVRSESSVDMPDDKVSVTKCFTMLQKSFDSDMGGFGRAPKFPQAVNFNFLARFHAANEGSSNGNQALHMLTHTLMKMANGGIHDHVSQGFHRYSTDDRWHVPHFEKMLYDQAQLAVAYAETYQITKEALYADVARDILQYVSRDLSHQDGGFYSAEDADSFPTSSCTEKKEGAFCVWTHDEIQQHLAEPVSGSDKKLSDLFSRHYGIKKKGNVDPNQDPHDELRKQNVLIIEKGLADTADKFGLRPEDVERHLARARHIIFDIREGRPRAGLDDKILTAWNGLMISGYSKCGQVLGDESFIERALAAATFIHDRMYDTKSHLLIRSSYTDKQRQITQIETPIEGFADDYAYLIRGLLDLYESCYDCKWLAWAEQLQETQNSLFWDKEHHSYYNTSNKDPSIVLRLKEDQDGAEPSANSVSCSNLLRLADFINQDEYRQMALKIFRYFAHRLVHIPIAVPEMVAALIYHVKTTKQIIIVGNRSEPATQDMLKCVHSHFIPNKILILADSKQPYLYEKLPILRDLTLVDGKPTAYVCENYACQLPVNSVGGLEKLLSGK